MKLSELLQASNAELISLLNDTSLTQARRRTSELAQQTRASSLDHDELAVLVWSLHKARSRSEWWEAIGHEDSHTPATSRAQSLSYIRVHYPALDVEARARVLRYTDLPVTLSVDSIIRSITTFEYDAPVHALARRVKDELSR